MKTWLVKVEISNAYDDVYVIVSPDALTAKLLALDMIAADGADTEQRAGYDYAMLTDSFLKKDDEAAMWAAAKGFVPHEDNDDNEAMRVKGVTTEAAKTEGLVYYSCGGSYPFE